MKIAKRTFPIAMSIILTGTMMPMPVFAEGEQNLSGDLKVKYEQETGKVSPDFELVEPKAVVEDPAQEVNLEFKWFVLNQDEKNKFKEVAKTKEYTLKKEDVTGKELILFVKGKGSLSGDLVAKTEAVTYPEEGNPEEIKTKEDIKLEEKDKLKQEITDYLAKHQGDAIDHPEESQSAERQTSEGQPSEQPSEQPEEQPEQPAEKSEQPEEQPEQPAEPIVSEENITLTTGQEQGGYNPVEGFKYTNNDRSDTKTINIKNNTASDIKIRLDNLEDAIKNYNITKAIDFTTAYANDGKELLDSKNFLTKEEVKNYIVEIPANGEVTLGISLKDEFVGDNDSVIMILNTNGETLDTIKLSAQISDTNENNASSTENDENNGENESQKPSKSRVKRDLSDSENENEDEPNETPNIKIQTYNSNGEKIENNKAFPTEKVGSQTGSPYIYVISNDSDSQAKIKLETDIKGKGITLYGLIDKATADETKNEALFNKNNEYTDSTPNTVDYYLEPRTLYVLAMVPNYNEVGDSSVDIKILSLTDNKEVDSINATLKVEADPEAEKAAAEKAKQEAEKKAAEEKAKQEAQKKAEAEKKAAEEKAKLENEKNKKKTTPTPKAKNNENVFLSVVPVKSIKGLPNGTPKTVQALKLPPTVQIRTTKGVVNATVAWDVSNAKYEPTIKKAQTFKVPGVISLPAGVQNTKKLPLTTSIKVSVYSKMQNEANKEDNEIVGIEQGAVYGVNELLTFTAESDIKSNSKNLNVGDQRYIPSTWKVVETREFKKGSNYTESFRISKAGNYTLSVTFLLQKYDGSNWVNAGDSDVKSVSFKILDEKGKVSKNKTAKTNDSTNIYPYVIGLGVALLALIGAIVAIIIKRKK